MSSTSPTWVFLTGAFALSTLLLAILACRTQARRLSAERQRDSLQLALETSEQVRQLVCLEEEGTRHEEKRALLSALDGVQASLTSLCEQVVLLAETVRSQQTPETVMKNIVWVLEHQVLPRQLSAMEDRLAEHSATTLMKGLDEQTRVLNATLLALPEQVTVSMDTWLPTTQTDMETESSRTASPPPQRSPEPAPRSEPQHKKRGRPLKRT